jgi:hypothetical protein
MTRLSLFVAALMIVAPRAAHAQRAIAIAYIEGFHADSSGHIFRQGHDGAK